jgi:hypothetical protein
MAVLPALVLYRASAPNALTHGPSTRPVLLLVSVGVFVVAWLAGVVGFVTSVVTLTFTPTSNSVLRKRAAENEGKTHFHTPHAIAGLVLFALTYLVLPLAVAVVLALDHHEQQQQHAHADRRHSRVSNSSSADGEYKDERRQSSSADKLFPSHPQAQSRRSDLSPPPHSPPPPPDEDDLDGDPVGAGERIRLHQGPFAPSAFLKERLWPSAWGRPRSQSLMRMSPELKDDSASRHSYQNHSASPSTATATAIGTGVGTGSGGGGGAGSPPATATGFVVLNRNKNALVQQAPGGDARGLTEDRENSAWLYLRRNLNYMGDVDYMISKLRGGAGGGGPAAGAGGATAAPVATPARKVALRYPPLGVVVGRLLAQAALLALVVFCALAIAARASTVLLALFVIWAAACYAAMYWLAWTGRPRGSVLVVAISRLRGQQHDEEETDPGAGIEEHAFSDVASQQAASTLGGATYASRPVYRRVHHDSGSGGQGDDDDDDNDRLEEELGRRDVRAAFFAPCSLLLLNETFSTGLHRHRAQTANVCCQRRSAIALGALLVFPANSPLYCLGFFSSVLWTSRPQFLSSGSTFSTTTTHPPPAIAIAIPRRHIPCSSKLTRSTAHAIPSCTPRLAFPPTVRYSLRRSRVIPPSLLPPVHFWISPPSIQRGRRTFSRHHPHPIPIPIPIPIPHPTTNVALLRLGINVPHL